MLDTKNNRAVIKSINKDFTGDINIPSYIDGYQVYLPDNCYGLFKKCKASSITFDVLDTTNVKDMSRMFMECKSLEKLNLLSFNTSNVENMTKMFYECTSLKKLNVLSFNTSKVKYMRSMFEGCTSLKFLDLSNFVTSESTIVSYMFDGCERM